jgi:hypothetical protein
MGVEKEKFVPIQPLYLNPFKIGGGWKPGGGEEEDRNWGEGFWEETLPIVQNEEGTVGDLLPIGGVPGVLEVDVEPVPAGVTIF